MNGATAESAKKTKNATRNKRNTIGANHHFL